MIDTKELRRLTQAVSGWSNCNQAWLDQSEDIPAAVVGHIDEDGNTYPIATIDCDQYYAAHQSLLLAKFYAAANPEAITELLDRLEAAEKDITIKEEVIDSLAVVVKRLDAQCDAAEAEAIEQSRLNGMGSEREAALMAKLEAAEKERDECNRRRLEAADHFAAQTALMKEQLETLRAKIEAMEKQEPLDAGSDVFRSAFEAALKAGNWPATRQGDGYRSPSTQIAWRIAFSTVNRLKLYLSPGAKGETKWQTAKLCGSSRLV